MKTKMLILAVLFATAMGFSNNPTYPEYLSENYVLKFEAEFVKKMDNQNLINHIEKNFISLFDNVTAINAQFSEEIGFYYLVFGEKLNSSKIELLKIEEEDYLNETYTYIDFSNIDLNENVQYCVRGVENPTNPFVCVGTNCRYDTSGCLGAICGVWNGRNCVQE